MSDAPVNAIQRILDYLWKDEERHFSEQDDESILHEHHIFHDLVKTRTWLDAVKERTDA
jgi:hypothetical protein